MKNAKLFGYQVHHLLYYFLTYSFFGWCIETVYFFVTEAKFVNRGFLNGPVCPVYGFAALFLLILLRPLKENLILFFLISVIITSILEYFTAFLLDTFFNSIQWNYSSEPFNLNGRICLKFSIGWGLFAVFFLNIIHPHVHNMIIHIPDNIRPVVSYLLVFCFIFDVTVTFFLNNSLKIDLGALSLLPGEVNERISNFKDASFKKVDSIKNKVYELRAKYRPLFDNSPVNMRMLPRIVIKAPGIEPQSVWSDLPCK